MKKGIKKFAFLSSLALATSFSVIACKPSEVVIHIDFSFNVSTKKKGLLYTGESEIIKVVESKDKGDKTSRDYFFSLLEDSDEEYISVNPSTGELTANKVTPKKGEKIIKEGQEIILAEDYEVEVNVQELESEENRTLSLRVADRVNPAEGGYNYASDAKAKTDILGELESFAMNNFLTGISLFENGGYIRYSKRVHLGHETYIPGYGFGLLAEGSLDNSWTPTGDIPDKNYLQTASSSDPLSINAWNATGSQISDLNSYISTSFYGTKIDTESTSIDGDYKWYPILADDSYLEPVAVDENGVEHPDPNQEVEDYKESHPDPEAPGYQLPKTSYKTWRFYVKTGDKIKYKIPTGSTNTEFNNLAVDINDYEFIFKMLLTGYSNLKRGTELASDTSYGIQGAYSYNLMTAGKAESLTTPDSYNNINIAWEQLIKNGGIRTSKRDHVDDYDTWKASHPDYIQFKLVNPVDQFTAKYTFSSNLYSPLPQSFLEKIGGKFPGAGDESPAKGNWALGAQLFGTFDDKVIKNRVLCLGPYYLDYWDKGLQTGFIRNGNWFECDEEHGYRYKIPGVRIRIITAAQTKPDAIYEEFIQGHLDSAGIPSSRMSPLPGDAKKTMGDSTFKLNVNSCTQERWRELNKQVFHQTTEYKVKKFMSNTNFLRGLFWSIDRKTFAKKHGTEPSFNYFSNAYQSDPNGDIQEEGYTKVYNQSAAHEKALKSFGIDVDKEKINPDYGYSKSKAIECFRAAINELKLSLGSSASNPKYITLNIQWMYPSDESEYGQDIGNFFTEAFNDPQVCGKRLILKVKHAADSNWEQVYNDHLMVGKFDLGFGAISGNTLSPLNFMEVLRSDNSSGFTLNWGADTSKIDESNPIIYDGKEWTYDALWSAADHGSLVSEGKESKSVNNGYINDVVELAPSATDPETGYYLPYGGTVKAKFDFNVKGEGAQFEIDHIQLYLIGAGTFPVTEEQIRYLDKDGVETEITKDIAYIELLFDEATVTEINDQIFLGNKYQKILDKLGPSHPDYLKTYNELHNKFTYGNYYSSTKKEGMWLIQVFYKVQIGKAEETEAEYDIYKDENDVPKTNGLAVVKY